MTTSKVRRAVITVGLAGGAAALGGTAIASAATSSSSPKHTATSSTSTSASSGTLTPPGPRKGAGRGGARPNPADDTDGHISAVDSSSLTVKSEFGTTRTYVLSSSTTVHDGPGTTSSISALRIGEHVRVHGTSTSTGTSGSSSSSDSSGSGTLRAVTVDVLLPHIDGVVSTVSGHTLTVTDLDGFTRTVQTSSSTSYTKQGASISASAMTAGTPIHATGTVGSNGTTLDATTIDVTVAPAAGSKPTPPAGPGKTGLAGAPTPRGSSTPSPSSSASPSVNGS